jgi:thiamine pyrophosphate-dependent acetolactate synthase large subunit-like protein
MKETSHYPGMYLGNPDIDFPMLAKSQGVSGERVSTAADLNAALQRGIAATRSGQPFLIEVIIDRTGDGAQSTWYQEYRVADRRSRNV